MNSIQQHLSIFNKFNFERQPVGVKFLFEKPPKGIEQLDKSIAFCEMLKEAQQKGLPFYTARENEACAGLLPLGMSDIEPLFGSGQVGPKLEIFKEPRANRRIYQVLPKLERNTVNYVIFSTLDKLSFEPDVLIITAKPSQAEIVLRASSYTNGEMYSSRTTTVLGCAWLYVYPYVSGKLNYIVTGLCWGMKALQVFPEGLILISIPYDLLPTLIQNLQDMNWAPPAYTRGRDAYLSGFQRLIKELIQEQQDS
ncbi:MAG: DUF169 domain-containing protein [Dehalococcoidia bacterium]|nr:DUF169 domain-containing protein [Dehalococcoidia bacterium]